MASQPTLRTLWQTLRHLRARQIRHQLARRLLPRPSGRPLPMKWRITHPHIRPEGGRQRSRLPAPGKFRFQNEERTFTGDWNDPGARKLWLYSLHSMSWIFDLETGREEWMERWIRGNPSRARSNGWEPYPLSLRLFNWCKHYSLGGRAPDPVVLASMEKQAGRLLANLEFHLDGNHLLENLLALAFAGHFMDERIPRVRRALRRIHSLLEEALADQFLPDGGHYELSPRYHAILLERILDLLNIWPRDRFSELREKLESTARSGLDWLDAVSVGGEFALFNDSAYDAAPRAENLLGYGAELLAWKPPPQTPLRSLPASGYHRSQAGPITVLFDCGPLGPRHQLGHAHGDLLSFCLWLEGRPIIVHPGVYEYLPGAMRDYCRSSAAHNTLAVEGVEQADFWASHRVGRRGRTVDVFYSVEQATSAVRMGASHTGYSHLPGRPIHRRELELTHSRLVIQDSLSARTQRHSRIYFHFHPECAVRMEKDAVRIGSSVANFVLESEGPMRIEDSWYCPEFGQRIRNQAVSIALPGLHCRTTLSRRG